MQKVSIVKGENRRETVNKSLKLISDEIIGGIGERQVIIKPNFVSSSKQLAASHVDQVRGLLDFLKNFYTRKVLIAEAACGDTEKGFKTFGYHRLLDEYNVELTDLNHGPYKFISIKNSMGKLFEIRVSSILVDKNNYLISAAKLKTHDTVVVTLSIKNMVMGAVLQPDKRKVHQGIKQINLNISKLAENVWPDLAVIDGLVGMEGNGPVHGNPKHVGLALAGTDPLAVDRICCEIMGIDFSKVGYLNHCLNMGLGKADLKEIEIIGHPMPEKKRLFRLHSSVEEQYLWR
jgi:uncharacterized protein (DUF362 family)